MSRKGHGQVRQSQVVTSYGPGALIDLPKHSAIVGGLDGWPGPEVLREIVEPRLSRKLQAMTAVRVPKLFAPPPDESDPSKETTGIRAFRFPEWFIVQEKTGGEKERSRRLVRAVDLDRKGKFEGCAVVATRFVRACLKGHVDDLDWWGFAHRGKNGCRGQLWLDERGTGGDLFDLVVRCGACGQSRSLSEAPNLEDRALGTCSGRKPWLGRNVYDKCDLPARLLIRTASNAYFSQVVSVLSLPDRGGALDAIVKELWDDLGVVEGPDDLRTLKKKPKVSRRLAPFPDDEVLAAIERVKNPPAEDRPVKHVELDALLDAKEGYGEDVPIDPDFHARRLPDRAWRRSEVPAGIEAVVQLHRLREVVALAGFTRFEAQTPDINGEYDSDVERAPLALEPSWFPAIENRGEGFFIQLRASAVKAWLERPAVKARVDSLAAGHGRWAEARGSKRQFPGGPYVLLHTLSHLLIQSLSMRCGYPASSIRERVYADEAGGRYGLLLYTGSPDAEGTLGGLVQQARYVEDHLAQALRAGALCSHDPICAQHSPGTSLENRWLHGAACHGCALVAETSCEMRNDHLDRALVVPVLGDGGAAFFSRA